MSIRMIKNGIALVALAALAACGGGGGGSTEAQVTGVANGQVLEGDSGTTALRLVVSLDKPVGSGVHLTWSTTSTNKGRTGSATGGASCGAGVDYISVTNRDLLIGPGASTGEIQVQVCADTTFEPTETLAVQWSSGGAGGTAVATIVNDDAGGINGTGLATSFGRDSNPLTSSDADGRRGFSFASVDSGACVRDNVTGLLWEGKGGAGTGTHDGTLTYTYANLAAFVAAVNAQALCGRTDWRLPTPKELSGIVDNAAGNAPVVDTNWFTNQQAAPYWTATSYQDGVAADAWFVDFATGTVAVDNKARAYAARLVSTNGTPAPAALPASCTDTASFTDHGDGTITDNRTGLMWKRCEEGQGGTSCSGSGGNFDWSAAVARPATVNADSGSNLGYGDWRLPTRAELSSIAERAQCFNPAANNAAFPAAEALGFWTATPYALNGSLAWSVDFFDGQVAPSQKSGAGSSSKRVRLVRAGQ